MTGEALAPSADAVASGAAFFLGPEAGEGAGARDSTGRLRCRSFQYLTIFLLIIGLASDTALFPTLAWGFDRCGATGVLLACVPACSSASVSVSPGALRTCTPCSKTEIF